MFLQGHYQNAYVTHDLDKAMELVTSRFGVTDFLVFEPELMLTTPDGEKPSKVRAALAWAGGLQIELIQPVSGYQDHYLPYLPKDPADPVPRFHHIALRRDDLDAMHDEIDRLGLPLVSKGEIPDLICVYLDARKHLGHYLEYVWASPEGWDLVGWPEGRPTR